MSDASRPCDTHAGLVAFKYPLPHLTESLKRQRKIKIVAVGSSSTPGTNGVIPYPHKLQFFLRGRYHGRMIYGLKPGLRGPEGPQGVSRAPGGVFAQAAPP